MGARRYDHAVHVSRTPETKKGTEDIESGCLGSSLLRTHDTFRICFDSIFPYSHYD